MIKFFRDYGYAVIKSGVSQELITNCLTDSEALLERNKLELLQRGLLVNDRLFRVVNFHQISQAARFLFSKSSSVALNLVDEVLGKGCVYTSLYFESGSEQPLHRDTPYFWTNPPYSYLGFWIALEDVGEENGMLTLVEKSHLVGEPDIVGMRQERFSNAPCPVSDDKLFYDYNASVKKMSDLAGLKQVSLPMKKGDILIWNASTMHGGTPHINKNISRKSMVFHLTPENVPVKYMDYFFHPEKNMPQKSDWSFYSENAREFAQHNTISFMHKIDVPIKKVNKEFELQW